MDMALRFCGAKSASPVAPFSSALSQRLHFAGSGRGSGFCITGNKLSCRNTRALRISCEGRAVDVIERNQLEIPSVAENEKQLSCVMKFGGSSVASADRMREVAELILGFPEERPVIVLSAMGKTTNKLLLVCYKWFAHALYFPFLCPFYELRLA